MPLTDTAIRNAKPANKAKKLFDKAIPVDEDSVEGARRRGEESGPSSGGFRTGVEFPIYGTEVGRSKAIIFVIDTSGSMKVAGMWGKPEKKITRLQAVKNELKDVIDNQLSSQARFNIITFADDVKPWKKKLVKASKSAKKSAKNGNEIS